MPARDRPGPQLHPSGLLPMLPLLYYFCIYSISVYVVGMHLSQCACRGPRTTSGRHLFSAGPGDWRRSSSCQAGVPSATEPWPPLTSCCLNPPSPPLGRDTEAQDRILDQQRAPTPTPYSIKVKDTESQKTNKPGHLSCIGLLPLSPRDAEFILPGPETSSWS